MEGNEGVKGLSNWSFTRISGILVIISYCTFTLVSWAFYPLPYTPWDNYLSRLGNLDYSPFGAWFYNIGCVLTGIALFPFFISLHTLRTEKKLGLEFLNIGQILGLYSAVALIAIGVFSEDQGALHMLASSVFFELNFVVLILLSLALALNPEFPKIAAFYGIFVSVSSLLFAFINNGPLLEWYTVFASLLYVGLVSLRTKPSGN